ncbi:MAG: BLUF domain-containing protein [Cyclobacteriaceae bacterium]
MELHRLIYTSFRTPYCTDEEIDNILISCERNNPSKLLTGILLHSKKRFIQYLEGDKTFVLNLYNKIKEDKRHAGVSLRKYEPIEERIFPSWNMGYKDVNTDLLEFNSKVTGKELMQFENILYGEPMTNDDAKLLKLFFEIN